MEKIKIAVFLLVISMGIITVISTNENRKLKLEIESQRSMIDSLHDENFNSSTELGRYEITLEHLKEVNPKAAKDFEDYMSHETE